MTKYIFLIILFDNPLELNQNNIITIKAGHKSLYYFGFILVDCQTGLSEKHIKSLETAASLGVIW